MLRLSFAEVTASRRSRMGLTVRELSTKSVNHELVNGHGFRCTCSVINGLISRRVVLLAAVYDSRTKDIQI